MWIESTPAKLQPSAVSEFGAGTLLISFLETRPRGLRSASRDFHLLRCKRLSRGLIGLTTLSTLSWASLTPPPFPRMNSTPAYFKPSRNALHLLELSSANRFHRVVAREGLLPGRWLPQPDPGTATVLVDELDARRFESAPDGQVI